MKIVNLFFCLIILLLGCKNDTQKKPTKFEAYQKKQHNFMLSKKSPLPPKYKLTFIGLNYFKYDSNYCFNANYKSVFNGVIIAFETNTNRAPKYIHKCNITFSKNDTTYTLKGYQQQNSTQKTLFIPFCDLTNRKLTYKSGRYLDIDIPNFDTFKIDFNYAYNPYCAYNKKYSCPIPPKENQLKISLNAGEKKFH